jgi:hypothetical protein
MKRNTVIVWLYLLIGFAVNSNADLIQATARAGGTPAYIDFGSGILNSAHQADLSSVQGWFIAHAPASPGASDGQDYLVRPPIPGPASMLLLGFGQIGVSTFGGKKLA